MEKLSHAYILSSADPGICAERAKELAARMLCEGRGEKPCRICRNCRKIFADVHPDVLRVGRPLDDKGGKRLIIPVDHIREIGADAAVMPNEASGKVYIIEDAEFMNEAAQNAALKMLEEPPEGVHFILCTANPGRILITVRSRCVELSCNTETKYDEKLTELAGEYVACLEKGSIPELTEWCFERESIGQKELPELLECIKYVLTEKLAGSQNKTAVMENIRLADRCLEYCAVNTGVKHITGLLAVRSVPLTEETN